MIMTMKQEQTPPVVGIKLEFLYHYEAGVHSNALSSHWGRSPFPCGALHGRLVWTVAELKAIKCKSFETPQTTLLEHSLFKQSSNPLRVTMMMKAGVLIFLVRDTFHVV